MHMKLVVIVLCTICMIAGFFGCQTYRDRSSVDANSETQEATILADRDTNWKVTLVPAEAKIGIENLHFISSDLGFANENSNRASTIYRTNDGARSWQKVSDISDFLISDMRFFDDREGILIAQNLSPSSSSMENGAFVFRTTDGGQHWQIVYSQVNALFSALKVDGNVGVIVGRSDIETPNTVPKTEARMAIIMSFDKGQTWINGSAELNNIAQDPNGRVGDFVRDVVFASDQRIVVLSANRRIYSTSGPGKSWVLLSEPLDEPASSGINELGLFDDGGLWVAGGNLNSHGKWSLVAVRDPDRNWEKHTLKNYFFSDVEFLSPVEVLAVGSIVHEENFGGNSELDRGVILHSSNGGRDWRVVYESDKTSAFTNLIKLSNSKLLVTGKNGILVSLERLEKY